MNRTTRAGFEDAGSRVVSSPAAAAAIDVLIELVDKAPTSLSLRELSRGLGVPRSTLHRIVSTLEAKGFVEQLDGGGYTVGEGLAQLGVRYGMGQLPELAQPILEDVHREVGETVNLAIPSGDLMLIVATVQSSEPLRMVSWLGRGDVMYASALGKAYLAALTPEKREARLSSTQFAQLTPKTLVTPAALRIDLDAVRASGFAVDDEESVEGVRCVGAAILAADGQPVAAVSISAPLARVPENRIPALGRLVLAASGSISVALRSRR